MALPLSRRAVLGAAIPGRPVTTLREAGRLAGVRIGASSEVDLTTDPDYARLLIRHCDLFAPNLNWQALAQTPGAAPVPIGDSVKLVTGAGLALTGYHLLWHKRLPPWFDMLGRAAAERAVVAHIRAMASAFGRDSFSWNVVNEAIRTDIPLARTYAGSFFDVAFGAAKDSAPGVLRVYNDYDLNLATPEHEARRTVLLHLLDELQGRAVPVQAVGLQSHLRSDTFDRFDPAVYRRFLAELAGRGLIVLITELDVLDLTTGDIAGRDRRIAEIYRRFLATALAEPAVRALVFWGLSDRHSWLLDPARRSLRRPDAAAGRPLPFDRDLRPKPTFAAILASLAAAPRRTLLRLGG